MSIALCIPAYNAAWCLPRLLDSATAQTVPFEEILVYDDCSEDETAEVARGYGVRVVQGDVNRGCSFAKNELARHTSCEWIHFHDADDELKSDFVAQAMKWISSDDPPDVVLFSYEERFEDGSLNGIISFDDNALMEDPVAYAIVQQINPFCGIYRRTSFLSAGGYDLDPNVLYNEDVAFHCRLARHGLTFRADPAVTVINHRSSSSMSQANLDRCIRAHYHVLKKAAEEGEERHHPVIAEKLWAAAGVAGSYLEWESAFEAAELARALDPSSPTGGGALFRRAARVAPRLALRGREAVIRLVRPHLRHGPQYHRGSKKNHV